MGADQRRGGKDVARDTQKPKRATHRGKTENRLMLFNIHIKG